MLGLFIGAEIVGAVVALIVAVYIAQVLAVYIATNYDALTGVIVFVELCILLATATLGVLGFTNIHGELWLTTLLFAGVVVGLAHTLWFSHQTFPLDQWR